MKTEFKLVVTFLTLLFFTIIAIASGDSNDKSSSSQVSSDQTSNNSASSSQTDDAKQLIEEYKNASYSVPNELIGNWIRQGSDGSAGERLEISSRKISGVYGGPLWILGVTDLGNGNYEFKVAVGDAFKYTARIAFLNISNNSMEASGSGFQFATGSYSRE